MSDLNKRDLILESIIKAYLSDNSPVGSSELNSRMALSIPASTIRVYFKKLSDEGALTKLHISGGRVPTDLAMREYWVSKLDTKSVVSVVDRYSLEDLVSDFGIYCLISQVSKNSLDEVINANNRYLILVIGDEEIALKYNEKVEKFLQSLVGISVQDLIKISISVGLNELSKKAKELLNSRVLFQSGQAYIYGELNCDELIASSFFIESLSDGISFDLALSKPAMAIKQDAIFYGQKAKMLCLGDLYTDFEEFFNKTKEW